MRFDHLLCFEAIKRYRSFSKAADNLYLSQSALSKQLKTFEDQLGVILFDRSQTTIKLTPIGERIAKYVEIILREHEQMLLEAKNYLENEEKKLRVASFYEMAQYGITDLIVSFEHDKPNFHVESEECNHLQMLHLLYNRQTDMIIGYRELWQKEKLEDGYLSVPLRSDDLVLVVHENHHLAKKDDILLSEAENEIFCFPREDSSLFEFFIETCKSAGFVPKHTLSKVRLGTIKKYVLKGMRVTLQPRTRGKIFFPEPIFRLINIRETPFLTLTMMTNKNLLPDVGREFINFACGFYGVPSNSSSE